MIKNWELKNTIYLCLTIAVIIVFIIVFRIDQLANCKWIGMNKDYKELIDHVYVATTSSQEDEESIKAYMKEAIARNTELYGDVTNEGVFIFTNSVEEAEKFRGGEVGVTHYSFFGLYVVIGPKGYNEDIVSHEMAHCEVAYRVGWYKNNKLPIWFNEGLATQVDYSEQFSLSEWNRITDNGNQVFEIKDLDTPQEFYVIDMDTRIDHYLLAKYDVMKWLEAVGKDGLSTLIEDYSKGADFRECYTELLLKAIKKQH